jgi:predicted transcriptional regulator
MSDELAIKELQSIKMLLILQLLESGVRQSVIASFLGVSEATVSRMLAGTKKAKTTKEA